MSSASGPDLQLGRILIRTLALTLLAMTALYIITMPLKAEQAVENLNYANVKALSKDPALPSSDCPGDWVFAVFTVRATDDKGVEHLIKVCTGPFKMSDTTVQQPG